MTPQEHNRLISILFHVQGGLQVLGGLLMFLIYAGAGGFFLAVAAYLVTPDTPWLDDAYITLHSARVVVTGVDPRYQAPALTGSTSPLHVALTAGFLAIGIPDSLSLHLMMALCL